MYCFFSKTPCDHCLYSMGCEAAIPDQHYLDITTPKPTWGGGDRHALGPRWQRRAPHIRRLLCTPAPRLGPSRRTRAAPAPALARSARWGNVLVEPKEIRGIVGCFHGREPSILGRT